MALPVRADRAMAARNASPSVFGSGAGSADAMTGGGAMSRVDWTGVGGGTDAERCMSTGGGEIIGAGDTTGAGATAAAGGANGTAT